MFTGKIGWPKTVEVSYTEYSRFIGLAHLSEETKKNILRSHQSNAMGKLIKPKAWDLFFCTHLQWIYDIKGFVYPEWMGHQCQEVGWKAMEPSEKVKVYQVHPAGPRWGKHPEVEIYQNWFQSLWSFWFCSIFLIFIQPKWFLPKDIYTLRIQIPSRSNRIEGSNPILSRGNPFLRTYLDS